MNDEPASPVCYAAQADDVYMGYAGRNEILAALNELIEAERAGARVALQSRKAALNEPLADLMKAIRSDEARWCAMLTRQVRRLGGAPSRRCGDFYGKAMAVDDPIERIVFLNRGQAWVVRKLKNLLPRVRDESLHAELRLMHASHETNIATAEAFIRGNGPAAKAPFA